MKMVPNKNFIEKGFTLIELLIVIALLGALAVGLLATVDPFEQLKKGTDTSRRNTTEEIYNSLIRYYAVKNTFPWQQDLVGMAASDVSMTVDTGYLSQVISAGELKPEFIQLAGSANLGKIFVTSTTFNGVRQNVAVCFLPESKSFGNDPNSQFNQDSTMGTSCVATAQNGTSCFWCVK
jgi:prepilin-type N-terminal cleavage/methylation domain-containing protein